MRGLSLVAASGGHSSSRCAGLSLSRPLLLRSTSSRRAGSVAMAHGPSCSAACGIFPDQGSNPCPPHWQADSQPLCHQGSPIILYKYGCLLFPWQNPRLLDDVSFHPCIRFKRWESERVLSFIPPDGNFRLISYRVSSQKYVDASNLLSYISVLHRTHFSLFHSDKLGT